MDVEKPLRLVLGSLIIQTKYQYSDRELVEQLTENPYYQYFIGLLGYQEEPPIDASTLVLSLKGLKVNVIIEANEYILAATKEKNSKSQDSDDDRTPPTSGGGTSESENSDETDTQGALILDAICALANTRYPEDFYLLNEAREKLETIFIRFCKTYGLARSRMYRRQSRKKYLALAKTKKRSTKKIRFTIRKQLSYVRRNKSFMSEGYAPNKKEIKLLLTIYKLYENRNTCTKQRSTVSLIASSAAANIGYVRL
jgi:hypothetical protein